MKRCRDPRGQKAQEGPFQEKVGYVEDTVERVLALHTEVCKGEVTSVEEGQDVERVITRSDVEASSYP